MLHHQKALTLNILPATLNRRAHLADRSAVKAQKMLDRIPEKLQPLHQRVIQSCTRYEGGEWHTHGEVLMYRAMAQLRLPVLGP